jgi:Ca-activated chloride channel family protein
MNMLSHSVCTAALTLIALLAGSAAAQTEDETRTPCTEDAMIVFDASGSMAGNTVQGLFSDITRIDEVRKALAQVLPNAAKFRKMGLITYGPGPYAQCNVTLDFRPMPNATEPIMSVVNALNPAGKTPLVAAVMQAAEVLDYRSEQGVIVLRRRAMRPRQIA